MNKRLTEGGVFVHTARMWGFAYKHCGCWLLKKNYILKTVNSSIDFKRLKHLKSIISSNRIRTFEHTKNDHVGELHQIQS
jgi:hypothetical protein